MKLNVYTSAKTSNTYADSVGDFMVMDLTFKFDQVFKYKLAVITISDKPPI